MLKTAIYHANSVEKLPKIHEQMNNLCSGLEKEDIVSVNTTEVSVPSAQFYSYTVMVVYQPRENG